MYKTKAIVNLIEDKDSIVMFTPLILWGVLTIAFFLAFAGTGKPWLGMTFAICFLMIIPVIIYTVCIRKKIDARNAIPRDVTFTVKDGKLMVDDIPLDITYFTNSNEILLVRVIVAKTKYGKTSFLRYHAVINSTYAQGMLAFLNDNGIPYKEAEKQS